MTRRLMDVGAACCSMLALVAAVAGGCAYRMELDPATVAKGTRLDLLGTMYVYPSRRIRLSYVSPVGSRLSSRTVVIPRGEGGRIDDLELVDGRTRLHVCFMPRACSADARFTFVETADGRFVLETVPQLDGYRVSFSARAFVLEVRVQRRLTVFGRPGVARSHV